jgi:hypothetical protein
MGFQKPLGRRSDRGLSTGGGASGAFGSSAFAGGSAGTGVSFAALAGRSSTTCGAGTELRSVAGIASTHPYTQDNAPIAAARTIVRAPRWLIAARRRSVTETTSEARP